MKQSPSGVYDIYSAGQLTSSLHRIQTRNHNLPLNPTMNNLSQFQTLTFFLFKIESNIISGFLK